MGQIKKFEILCVDSSGNTRIKTPENLFFSLMSNPTIFKIPQLNDGVLTDVDTEISIKIHRLDKTEASELVNSIFLVICTGFYKRLEPYRLPILNHINELGFDHIYILSDDVSANISKEIYPRIYELENKLRRFLVKFFVTKLGPKWWNRTADSNMQEKTSKRKNNETTFLSIAENKVFLIDFNELGKIVTSQSSGFLEKEDIIKKIENMEESIESIKKLKLEVKSNYIKYFKDTFKENNFQEIWESLEKIRHKVAHNSLFTFQDIETVEFYHSKLNNIFKLAEEKLDEVVFTFEQNKAIYESISSDKQFNRLIKKDIMLKELLKAFEWSEKNGKKLGRNEFVGHLSEQGYKYSNILDNLTYLKNEGIIDWEDCYSEEKKLSYKVLILLKNAEDLNINIEEIKN